MYFGSAPARRSSESTAGEREAGTQRSVRAVDDRKVGDQRPVFVPSPEHCATNAACGMASHYAKESDDCAGVPVVGGFSIGRDVVRRRARRGIGPLDPPCGNDLGEPALECGDLVDTERMGLSGLEGIDRLFYDRVSDPQSPEILKIETDQPRHRLRGAPFANDARGSPARDATGETGTHDPPRTGGSLSAAFSNAPGHSRFLQPDPRLGPVRQWLLLARTQELPQDQGWPIEPCPGYARDLLV